MNKNIDKQELLLQKERNSFTSIQTDHQQNPHIYNNYFEYIVSMVGFAVGYGSFWRFPYLIYKNGGGVFLIPYLIALVVVGMPLLYLQTVIGQMLRGNFKKYFKIQYSLPFIFKRIHKGLKYLGICIMLSCFHLAGYYNIILTYSYRFIFSSFNPQLPFKYQSPLDNTYFSQTILQKSSSINEFQSINPFLFLLFIMSMLIIYFVVHKGVKTSGKIIVFTALLPYFFFILLFIRSLFLQGAYKGVAYLFTPKWSKLFQTQIWVDAIVQVFYQVSLAMSGIVNLASMKPRRQKILLGIYIIPIGILGCGMLCALNIFMYLGYFTNELGIQINDLTLSGPQLCFNIFPKALAILPLSNFWICLFFIGMVLLGIDTQFAFIQSLFCYLKDQFHSKKQYIIWGFEMNVQKAKKLVIFCILLFAPTMTSHAGIYYLQFYDKFVSTVPFTLNAVIQLYFFVYIFKFSQLQLAVEKYTKQKCPGWIQSLLQGKFLMIILLLNLALGIFNQIFAFFEYTFGFYLFGWFISLYPFIYAYYGYIKNKQQKWHLTFAEIQSQTQYIQMNKYHTNIQN